MSLGNANRKVPPAELAKQIYNSKQLTYILSVNGVSIVDSVT